LTNGFSYSIFATSNEIQKRNIKIMKNTIGKIIIQVFAVAFLLILATACKKEVSGVILDPSDLIIGVGNTATLTVTFMPHNATNTKVSWESSDPNVATVDNGKITGKAVGRVNITVITQDGGRTAKCWVTVIQPIEPEEMIWVEGGTFIMGCTEEQGDDCFSDEKPIHQVTLSGFYISKYPVTQKEWVLAMGTNSSLYIGDEFPFDYTTWEHTQKYIAQLNAYTGKNYRLPTEAEWEYAARGGNKSEGYKYSGSNNFDDVAWHVGNAGFYGTRPVGKKLPNELGIYDMSGNVWEWCSDWYGEYPNDSQANPISTRVIRGGSWSISPLYSRVSSRMSWAPETIVAGGGFRLVLDKE